MLVGVFKITVVITVKESLKCESQPLGILPDIFIFVLKSFESVVLLNENLDELHKLYIIFSITGVITVRESLKCESKESCLTCLKEDKVCSLVIVATDRGQPRQRSSSSHVFTIPESTKFSRNFLCFVFYMVEVFH